MTSNLVPYEGGVTPVQIEMWYRSLFGGAETVVQRFGADSAPFLFMR